METVPESPSRSHNALLIIDVQVGLVEWIPGEIQSSVLSRIGTLVAVHSFALRRHHHFAILESSDDVIQSTRTWQAGISKTVVNSTFR